MFEDGPEGQCVESGGGGCSGEVRGRSYGPCRPFEKLEFGCKCGGNTLEGFK